MFSPRLIKVVPAIMLYAGIMQAQPFFQVGGGTNSPILSLYADTVTNYLLAGGDFTQAGNTNCAYIATWNGSIWDSTRNQLLQQSVRSIERFNNEIYIGGEIGWYDSLGNIIAPFAAKWDSSVNAWVDFGANAKYGIQHLYTYNADLYVTGSFDSIGGIYSEKIARYNGTTWYSYPPIDTTGGGWSILTAKFYNGDLYVGGNFDSQIASNMKDIAKWDGTQWLSVGGGLSGFFTGVEDFIIYQGKLIVAGYFKTMYGDPGNNIAAWDGSQWSQLGSGIDVMGGVNCLAVYNNELWVGGGFSNAGGIPATHIAKWDGTQWYNVGATLDIPVYAMAVLGNDLYIAGAFWTMNGDTVNRIIRYNYLTGFQELEAANNELEIFPNPTSGTLNIKNFNSVKLSGHPERSRRVEVYNTLGEKVKTFKLTQRNSHTELVEVFIGDLPKGLYLVQLKNEAEIIYSQKIILQ